MGELSFCSQRAFTHAPLLRVSICVSWTFLVKHGSVFVELTNGQAVMHCSKHCNGVGDYAHVRVRINQSPVGSLCLPIDRQKLNRVSSVQLRCVVLYARLELDACLRA